MVGACQLRRAERVDLVQRYLAYGPWAETSALADGVSSFGHRMDGRGDSHHVSTSGPAGRQQPLTHGGGSAPEFACPR